MTEGYCQPTLAEDGTIKAGGMTLFRLEGEDLVFPDRWRQRARARGCAAVRVDPVAVVELIITYLDRRRLHHGGDVV